MILHMPQQKIESPVVQINGTNIERVNDLHCVGITINIHLNWESHINERAKKNYQNNWNVK